MLLVMTCSWLLHGMKVGKNCESDIVCMLVENNAARALAGWASSPMQVHLEICVVQIWGN